MYLIIHTYLSSIYHFYHVFLFPFKLKLGINSNQASSSLLSISSDPLAFIIDLREHDVPYSVRVSIDLDLRVGSW